MSQAITDTVSEKKLKKKNYTFWDAVRAVLSIQTEAEEDVQLFYQILSQAIESLTETWPHWYW